MARIGRKFVPSSTIARRCQVQDDRRAAELRRTYPSVNPARVQSAEEHPGIGSARGNVACPVVVEVALVPVSIDPAGVVEVAIVPAPPFKSYPKPSRVTRAIVQSAARLLDRRKLVKWAFDVKTRDQWKDRYTGARLLRTLNLDPTRAEAHHLVSREVRAVRYDVRNGICLSMVHHEAVERGELRIVGTAWFQVGGVRYIDASAPVRFVRA